MYHVLHLKVLAVSQCILWLSVSQCNLYLHSEGYLSSIFKKWLEVVFCDFYVYFLIK